MLEETDNETNSTAHVQKKTYCLFSYCAIIGTHVVKTSSRHHRPDGKELLNIINWNLRGASSTSNDTLIYTWLLCHMSLIASRISFFVDMHRCPVPLLRPVTVPWCLPYLIKVDKVSQWAFFRLCFGAGAIPLDAIELHNPGHGWICTEVFSHQCKQHEVSAGPYSRTCTRWSCPTAGIRKLNRISQRRHEEVRQLRYHIPYWIPLRTKLLHLGQVKSLRFPPLLAKSGRLHFMLRTPYVS